MRLFYWGGPVYCNTLDSVAWKVPTTVFCKPISGSSSNGAFFSSLGSDKFASLCAAAKLDPSTVNDVAMGGFSAFHGFANLWLKDEAARAKTSYVHLADACFLGAGATSPHQGFAAFAREAVGGKKRMTVTSNGPLGKNLAYDGPDGTHYSLTSGGSCVSLFWDEATGGRSASKASVPPGVPAPTFAKRVGELYWFHYEDPYGNDPHLWHANKLAVPYIQAYGAGDSVGAGSPLKLLSAIAGGIGGYYAAKRWL